VDLASRGTVPRWCRGSSRVRPPHGPGSLVVLARCTPPGAAGEADLGALTQALQAEHTADGGDVNVPRALCVPPRAPRMTAQRVVRSDPSPAHHCLLPKP